ncbi:hypothetical protein ACOMHN_003942 [Nucella lapillus]
MKIQVVQIACALTGFATILMTLPWVQGQEMVIYKTICETILRQRSTDTNNCFEIKRTLKFDDSIHPIAPFLLCCLGAFGSHPVKINYNQHMNVSLGKQILKIVKTDSGASQAASYVKTCTPPSHNNSYNLRDVDFQFYLVNGKSVDYCEEPRS